MQSSFFAPSNAGVRCVDGWSEGEGEEKADQQMRKLELEAYAAVVRAFGAQQSELFTWEKERLMSDLRKELRVTEEQHRVILGEVDDSLLEYRPPSCRTSPGPTAMDGNANFSQSRKKQKTETVGSSTFLESAVAVAAGGGTQGALSKRVAGAPRAKKAAAPKNLPEVGFDIPVDNWLGRRVMMRWPDDGCFYEAVITRYDRERGLHALVYDMDTTDETWDWVNLKDMGKNDLIWMDAPRVPLAGKRVPPEQGAGVGRDNVNQGMKWQETAAHLGKQKTGQRGQQTMSSPPQQARPWTGSMAHLDIGLVNGRKGSNSAEIPEFSPFLKEADALEQEESMEKPEHIKKMAGEHEVVLRRALANVGELEDDSDT